MNETAVILEPVEKALLVAQGMERRRALDVMILDMRELMVITDYFVICHGRSTSHVDAITDEIEDFTGEHGLKPRHREGGRHAKWMILDFGSVVAHIFTEETREYYDLERLWEDAPVVEHQSDIVDDEIGELPGESAEEEILTDDELLDDELVDEDDENDEEEDELNEK